MIRVLTLRVLWCRNTVPVQLMINPFLNGHIEVLEC